MATTVLIRVSVILVLLCVVQGSLASNWIPVENSEGIAFFWDRDSTVVDRKEDTIRLWSRQILPHVTLRADGAFFYKEALNYVNISCRKREIAPLEQLYVGETNEVIKRVWREESEFGAVQPDSTSMDLLRSVCQFFAMEDQKTPNLAHPPTGDGLTTQNKSSAAKGDQKDTAPQDGQKAAEVVEQKDESLERLVTLRANYTDNIARFIGRNVWHLFSGFVVGHWNSFRSWVMHANPSQVDSALRSAYHGADWSYRGAFGPQQWSKLKIEYNLCSEGIEQSPIDVEAIVPADLQPLQLNYQATPFSLDRENHRKLEILFHQPGSLQIGTHIFTLKRLEFHQPAEHKIRGYRAPFSLHLYHRDSEGNRAVVAVNVIVGHENIFIRRLLNNLPLAASMFPYEVLVPLDPTELLPISRNYFTYVGSLTYPPCTAPVLWFLMDSPISISIEQQKILETLVPINARPPQALNGRIVKFWQND